MKQIKIKDLKFATLELADPSTHELVSFATNEKVPFFTANAKFHFRTGHQGHVEKIVLTVKNGDPAKYGYDLYSAFICCNLINKVNKVYYLQYNFLKVNKPKTGPYYIEIPTYPTVDSCNLILSNMSIIFPSVNVSDKVSDFEHCPKTGYTSIPEDKDGSIIVSI